MAFKPVIIDVGVFKQLPSGQPLDVGGWTLPTTGGTENYALIADVSGNAVWAQPDHGDLAGLGDDDHPQYVRNNGETSNVDLGSQTFTTTGTVVGSNIPAPTASNQILQADAANVASWSTDLTDLTSLTVDDIAIDGTTILCTTGTISFGDDHLITTGDVTATDIHITGSIETVNYIQFDQTYVDGTAEGRLQWNLEDGTLEVGMPGGIVNLQIGQEVLLRARNVTGSTILNGRAVYITGSQGNRPTIALANATNVYTAGAIGLATEDISNNSNGYVTTMGLVRDVNTNAWAEGTLLWLDPATPGWFVSAMPDAPNSRVAIGYVLRQHASEGIIVTDPFIIPRYENASGVKAEANSDGDFLRWDAANSWWDRHGDSSIDHGSISGLADDDHPQYPKKTGWALNHNQLNLSTTTVNSSTREVSIAPVGASFEFWVEGIKYTKTTTQTVAISDTEGIWFVYFNNSGVLTTSQTPWDLMKEDWAGVCIVYWDATNNMFSLNGPEHHTYEMDAGTHHYLHHTFSTRWSEGLGVTINGDYLDVASGKIHDEDIEIWIKDVVGGSGIWAQDLSPAEMPVFYRSGSADWRLIAPSTTPLYISSNIPQINTETGGVWSWENAGVNEYFAYWVVASNDQDTPVVIVPGQESSGTLTGAQDGNQLADMNFGDLPVVEAKVIARVIIRRAVSSPYYQLIEVNDYRNVVDEPSGSGAVVGDHGHLTGLGDDDHPQYLKYTGATAALDMGVYTVTTTGTVVGSNIPSPTVAAKVLTSTGVGTATWQDPSAGVTDHGALTGLTDDDHPQYVTYTGATGTVNLGAQALTTTSTVVGSNIPAPTLAGQMLQCTSANNAAWTRDVTGLTSLVVDNITINGAAITSDTGAISFGDENLSTTGTLTSGQLDVTSSTYPPAKVTRTTSNTTGRTSVLLLDYESSGDVADTFGPGILFTLSDTGVSDSSLAGIYGLRAGADNTGDLAFYCNVAGSMTKRMSLSSAGALTDMTSITVDNLTLNGAVITSDTGTVGFSDDDLSTTGKVVSRTLHLTQGIYVFHGDSAYTYDKVYSNYTAGNPVTGTLVIDFPNAYDNTFFTLKVRGYNYLATLGPWEVNFGGYPYNASPDRWYNYRASVTGEVPFTSIRVGYNGNTGKVCLMLGVTTSNWYYPITEITDVACRGGVPTGLETGWDIAYYTDETNFYNNDATQQDPQTVSWTRDYNAPSADNMALTSTGDKVASWNVTCLADVLAQEVPSASGSQRKFVLTADSASQFEIESAPWPLALSSTETVYVRTTGNDTTGDGSSGSPFLTLTRTIQYLGELYMGDQTVIVDIGEGVFTESGTLSFQHPFGSQVVWRGVSEQITSQNTTSIGSTGTSLGFNNLYYYDVTFTLPVGKSVSVGDYIAVREVSGGTNPQALYGCHYVSGWVSGTRVATVRVVYRNGAPKAAGTVTCTVELIKTVIAFDNKNGIKTSGPYHVGLWEGLVIEGNYSSTNTSAKYGIWNLNSPVISLGGSSATGKALGVVGFQTGLYAQNNALIFADYAFVSRCATRCANAQNGGILNLRWARLSGANNNGIFAFNGSTVAAQGVCVVAVGNESINSYQGSFIDATSSYVDQNNATYSFAAYRWAAIDATSATESDGVTPTTDGNNDGSYIIGL